MFISLHQPIDNFRLKDDILVIVSKFFNIDILTHLFPNLKLNIVTDENTVFLDLKIHICRI